MVGSRNTKKQSSCLALYSESHCARLALLDDLWQHGEAEVRRQRDSPAAQGGELGEQEWNSHSHCLATCVSVSRSAILLAIQQRDRLYSLNNSNKMAHKPGSSVSAAMFCVSRAVWKGNSRDARYSTSLVSFKQSCGSNHKWTFCTKRF